MDDLGQYRCAHADGVVQSARREASPGDAAGADIRDYCRRARAVRHRYRADPARMHRELIKLAGRDAYYRADAKTAAASSVPEFDMGQIVRRFAGQVMARLDGSILRYSERLRLLQLAERMGIGRFEANLVIAVIQHRCRTEAPVPCAHRMRWLGVLLAVAAIQALIIVTAAAILLR